FAAAESTDRAAKLPNTEAVLSHGFDVLLCTEDVDEFCFQMIRDYKEKEFKNVGSGDLGLASEEEKEAAKASAEENKDLLAALKEVLGDKVKEVRLSRTLGEHPVALSSDGPLSIEMEKVLRTMPGADPTVKSEKILEINENHSIFETLKASADDKEKLALYADVLYGQARLIEGLSLEDPVAYAKAVCTLIQ
ncbi:MAG: molecular chaperone HtpG, partial [Ruminococcus sp.]|nr:molecular chaperone HtpG [Candidatus Apopatosoma intestinale]